ncbi:MAG: DNA repair protein RadA, partial [Clostridia bacterium]|nr:DNA repair protein RadA [Clostridia bacterium]
MKGPKTVYTCTECDYQSPKWLGKCPSCGAWNSFTEETYAEKRTAPGASAVTADKAEPFRDMAVPEYMRSSTGIEEFDRVLGGGLVVGSAILVAGEPGIGKSTLLMQLCGKMGDGHTIMYVSGEESRAQLKMRATRLGVDPEKLFVQNEVFLDSILKEYERISPEILIIDSIQTLYSSTAASAPGSVTQVRECTSALIARIKADGASLIIVGHVNKEGGIAGPKVLEHMVDAVISFEGDRSSSNRIVRAVKNRFGSTNEIGVFEMTGHGLECVSNPSEMLLEGRPEGVSGSCAACILEGTRPIIAEIQALVTPTVFPSPRRTADGIDYNRMCLLLAVIEKRLGLRFSTCDVYMNVVGGMRIDDPAADSAIVLALISSLKDVPVPHDLIAMGEIGLAGELRSVASAEQRINEASRLGFSTIALPKKQIKGKKAGSSELVGMNGIYDAVALLAKSQKKKEKSTERQDVTNE